MASLKEKIGSFLAKGGIQVDAVGDIKGVVRRAVMATVLAATAFSVAGQAMAATNYDIAGMQAKDPLIIVADSMGTDLVSIKKSISDGMTGGGIDINTDSVDALASTISPTVQEHAPTSLDLTNSEGEVIACMISTNIGDAELYKLKLSGSHLVVEDPSGLELSGDPVSLAKYTAYHEEGHCRDSITPSRATANWEEYSWERYKRESFADVFGTLKLLRDTGDFQTANAISDMRVTNTVIYSGIVANVGDGTGVKGSDFTDKNGHAGMAYNTSDLVNEAISYASGNMDKIQTMSDSEIAMLTERVMLDSGTLMTKDQYEAKVDAYNNGEQPDMELFKTAVKRSVHYDWKELKLISGVFNDTSFDPQSIYSAEISDVTDAELRGAFLNSETLREKADLDLETIENMKDTYNFRKLATYLMAGDKEMSDVVHAAVDYAKNLDENANFGASPQAKSAM